MYIEALEILGAAPGQDLEPAELRRAFRARAAAAHPDGGGSAEAFQRLRRAYALLRRGGASPAERAGAAAAAAAAARRLERQWERWEQEVESFGQLAGEGDVLYWRPERAEPWRLAVVLAVQVVHEPASGPHGWIYLQPLVEDEGEPGVFFADEWADMEQVEPLSPDGVHWCPAEVAGRPGEGRWRLGPRPAHLPPCAAREEHHH
ncbi:unnamed protein product [Prorocentrum cordatum]|uniref:J domain-containing protein n=1 Tax=Prorocentrum cordatum TaxID=2364126 RepID=A0ABN9WIP3_9DINO|nr:unnamed protein product [Polarella glacialis]